MRAKQIMSNKVITIQDRATVGEARKILQDHKISSLPVLSQDSDLIGIVCQTDFFNLNTWFQEQVSENSEFLSDFKVRDIMTREVVTLSEDATIEEVVRAMIDHAVHRVLIANEEKLLGIISTMDVLKAGFILRKGSDLPPVL
jgi:CBS-domain-containing membrane protein